MPLRSAIACVRTLSPNRLVRFRIIGILYPPSWTETTLGKRCAMHMILTRIDAPATPVYGANGLVGWDDAGVHVNKRTTTQSN
eukprot:scaffold61365_cov16-Prasinocladus_malaysianus.AAC.1